MDSNSGNRTARTGLRDRRYAIRYPFTADAEVLDLKSGSRLRCVTSDLSMGGCFVCTRHPFETGTRVRFTLKFRDKTHTGLAAVRLSKQGVGMGLEFLEPDWETVKILLEWIECVHSSR